MKILNFVFVISSIFFTSAETAFAFDIPLDVHVHFHPKGFYHYPQVYDGAEAFLSQNVVKKAFLVSPSFQVTKKQVQPVGWAEAWMGNLKMRTQLDEKTSEIVQKHPDRFYGLCGFNTSWTDGIDVVTNCLSRKGMVGVKIHTAYSGTSSTDPEFDRISVLFQNIGKYKPIVLWHPYDDVTSDIALSEKMKTELSKLYEIISTFPHVTFIIAHSFGDGSLINFFSELESKYKKLENVYLEMSVTLPFAEISDSEAQLLRTISHAWRKFGMDRVLYGSDLGCIPDQELHLSQIKNHMGLSEDETTKLLRLNSERFLQKIIQSQPY